MTLSSFTIINSFDKTELTTRDSTINEANLSSYLKNFEAISPVVKNEIDMKNVIFTYSTEHEKGLILDYIVKTGLLLEQLRNLPFIFAKIPYSEYSNLKNSNIKVFLDKQVNVVPKDFLINGAKATVPPDYKAPIYLLHGESLAENYQGEGIKIAVLDTGVDFYHPDLKGHVAYNKSFVTKEYGYYSEEDPTDGNGHGTHVAALAAGTGKASNSKFIGIAPKADIYSLKVVDSQGSATFIGISRAIDEAIAVSVDIITISLGFNSNDPDNPLSLALDEATNKYGIVVTVSAGNSGPGIGTVTAPATARSVISVGASFWDNTSTTYFSSRGPSLDYRYDPDVTAPGNEIISALASDSILDRSEKYYSESLVITGTGGNYIAQSGTSMAAPIVAGSVALLLNKYPDLSPQSLRAALMSSATNTGEEEYVQGAGFVNLQQADELLSNTYTSGKKEINVISLLPQRNIFPDNQILYPGNELKVNFQFVAGKNTNIKIDSPNSTISSLLSFNHSISSLKLMESGGYYQELLVTFTVPLNPVPGTYESELKIITGIQNFTIDLGPVTVDLPHKEIAWVSWYTDSADNPTGNYAMLNNLLLKENINLVVIDKAIDNSWIYQYDTLIFPDNELSIPINSISLLSNYIASGGKIIVISSFYPFSNIENYNSLTESFGIRILDTQDISIEDIGIRKIPNVRNEKAILNNFANLNFDSISNFQWLGGTHLNVANSPSNIIVSQLADSTPVIAGFLGNESFKGQLFVFGSEFWFYNDYFDQSEELFSKDFFNYIVNTSEPFVNIINKEEIIEFGNFWNASLFVGQSNFENPINANITIIKPDESIETVNITQGLNTYGGLISYNPNQIGKYTLNVKYDKKMVQTSFVVYNSTISFNFTLSSSIKSVNIPRFLEESNTVIVDEGNSIDIKFFTNMTIQNNINISAQITLIPELLHEISGYLPLENGLFTKEITFIKQNNTYFMSTFDTSGLTTLGFYDVELTIENNKYLLDGSFLETFYLSAPDPEINLATSTINGKALSTYDTPSDPNTNPVVLSISPAQKIDITIKSSKIQKSGNVFILFVPYFPFIDSGIIIDFWQINQTGENLFEGQITLPKETSISLSNGRKMNFVNNLYSAFLIMLRDDNGNNQWFSIITLSKSNILADLNIDEGILFFFFVLLPGLIVLVYYLRNKGRRKQDIYNYNFNNQFNQPNPNYFPGKPLMSNQPIKPADEILFCPFCGSNMLPGSNFCMECGKKIK
jgi:subtilisin family serine protease